jgi:hypothetical protein
MIRNPILPKITLEPALILTHKISLSQTLLRDLKPPQLPNVCGCAVGIRTESHVSHHGAVCVYPAEAVVGPCSANRVAGGDGGVVCAGDREAVVVACYVCRVRVREGVLVLGALD